MDQTTELTTNYVFIDKKHLHAVASNIYRNSLVYYIVIRWYRVKELLL